MKIIEGYNVKIFTDNIEENALEQIKELLSIDVFSDKKNTHNARCPRRGRLCHRVHGHLGDKVIPNIVGVDIGCGMRIPNSANSDIDYHAFHEHIQQCAFGNGVREDRRGFKPLVARKWRIYREAKRGS